MVFLLHSDENANALATRGNWHWLLAPAVVLPPDHHGIPRHTVAFSDLVTIHLPRHFARPGDTTLFNIKNLKKPANTGGVLFELNRATHCTICPAPPGSGTLCAVAGFAVTVPNMIAIAPTRAMAPT
ncbi:hypothetical protein [Oceaniglobus ichthyenteri]|uniref:hypothetical protein n=1 Tax=Oceaniglobus ichthyenteri TaxID=2136177 RepID=UPI000F837B06|nr:hypothetical protein [Oceaniglobus ichthyenteri]